MPSTFTIRCLAPEECSTRLNVEQAVSPFTKSYAQPVLSTAQWRTVKIAFRMAENYQGNDYFVDFWMGQQVQTVEVSNITLINHCAAATPADVGSILRMKAQPTTPNGARRRSSESTNCARAISP